MSSAAATAMFHATVYRTATLEDASPLSALATQVFLDTYATRGVDIGLAQEALTLYSVASFRQRLQMPGVEITVAARSGHLVAFLDLDSTTTCPVASVEGLEVLRLYVQSPFQRSGVGTALMARAERKALELHARHVWLTAWAGNARARAFYRAIGYADVGATQYIIERTSYENRVFAKRIAN